MPIKCILYEKNTRLRFIFGHFTFIVSKRIKALANSNVSRYLSYTTTIVWANSRRCKPYVEGQKDQRGKTTLSSEYTSGKALQTETDKSGNDSKKLKYSRNMLSNSLMVAKHTHTMLRFILRPLIIMH